MLVAPSARQRCSITKTDKWLKLLTLPLPISKCLQVSTMFASLTAGLIKKQLTGKGNHFFQARFHCGSKILLNCPLIDRLPLL